MQVGVMITNNGAHPPEKLAETTAWKIADLIRVSDTPVDPALPEIERDAILERRATFSTARSWLENNVKGILQELSQKGKSRHQESHTDHDYDGVLSEIVGVTKGTALEGHFNKPEVQDRIREILQHDTHHNAHIERQWHAKNNATSSKG
jgi:hypothetical protein